MRAVNAILFAFALEAAAGQVGDLSREEMQPRSTRQKVFVQSRHVGVRQS